MKILIVEDEREIAEIIQECLEAEGFTCFTCYDGYSALLPILVSGEIGGSSG